METQSIQEVFRRSNPITGRFVLPGDKSITHRALFFSALREGRTIIHNPSSARDCRNTYELLESLGCCCKTHKDHWVVDGSARSVGPALMNIHFGNSGTTARLAIGFLSGERGTFSLTGDSSLSRRPMEHVTEPLRFLGADIVTTDGKLPVTVIANRVISGLNEPAKAIEVSSAQVHAALTLAGLRSESGVRIRRIAPMRDHTLRMAKKFGLSIQTHDDLDQVYPVTEPNGLQGISHKRRGLSTKDPEPNVDLLIPGDVSSASFLITAALLVSESDLQIHNVGLNPTRTGFLECVKGMGGKVSWKITDNEWEPRGSIHVQYSPGLHGIILDNSSHITPLMMIDELPLLAFLGTQANGETVIRDAGELRVKESDRISATVAMMGSLGVKIEELEDGFRLSGQQKVSGGGRADHRGDHRLAMLAGVAGLIAEEPVIVPNPDVAGNSWPGFWDCEAWRF